MCMFFILGMFLFLETVLLDHNTRQIKKYNGVYISVDQIYQTICGGLIG